MKSKEPYRFLFPIGLFFAVAGTAVWIKFALDPGTVYPGVIHARVMIGAFLLAFVCGFLMTAIPKMTASYPARRLEIWIAALLTVASGIAAYHPENSYFFLLAASALLFLLIFAARRALKRTKAIPPFFAFVGVGLLSGLVGSALLFFAEPGFIYEFGRRLFFQGMILCLVLGIGSRLIPVITGNAIVNRPLWNYAAVAMLIPVSFAAEAAGYVGAGGFLKAMAATMVAAGFWGLAARSKKFSRLAPAMRISGALVIGGLWMAALYPAFAVHWMHLTYVGGFGLMTFTVASRVTLAHGHYDLAFEARSRSLPVIGGLILLAAGTRVFAPFYPPEYIPHLAYAAFTWVIAVTIWGAVFLRKLVKDGTHSEGC